MKTNKALVIKACRDVLESEQATPSEKLASARILLRYLPPKGKPRGKPFQKKNGGPRGDLGAILEKVHIQ